MSEALSVESGPKRPLPFIGGLVRKCYLYLSFIKRTFDSQGLRGAHFKINRNFEALKGFMGLFVTRAPSSPPSFRVKLTVRLHAALKSDAGKVCV